MVACSSRMFTLLVCACIYTVVECDCSSILQCTMYTIQEVGRKVDNMQSNMAVIANQLNQTQDIHGIINDLQNKVENLTVQTEKQNKVIEDLQQQNVLHDKPPDFVSFTAYAAASQEYNKGDVVQFDTIVVNYGGYFDSSTGYFTCPYTGYYLLTVSILASRAVRMAVDIIINDTVLVGASAKDTKEQDQAAATTVVKCDSEQLVWVKSRHGGFQMEGGIGRDSSFTGALLRVL